MVQFRVFISDRFPSLISFLKNLFTQSILNILCPDTIPAHISEIQDLIQYIQTFFSGIFSPLPPLIHPYPDIMADLPKENQANKNKPISVSVLALPPLSAALPKLPPPPPPPPPQDPAVQDLTQEDSKSLLSINGHDLGLQPSIVVSP